MEPAPFSAGNAYALDHLFPYPPWLQWSRRLSAPETRSTRFSVSVRRSCFNGAGAFQRRKPGAGSDNSPGASNASMEPAPFSAGNEAPPIAAEAAKLGASMEPAPFSAGNWRMDSGERRSDPASMEPAPFSAGNLARSPLLVDSRLASMEPAPFSAGNMPDEAATTEESTGFNGAGAFQRRKPLGDTRCPRISCRFNGAGAFQRRKHPPAALSADSASGFNGAGAFQRRKPGAGRWTQEAGMASMEPAPFSAGNPFVEFQRLLRWVSLQWSRRLSAPETGLDVFIRYQTYSFNGAGAFQRRKLVEYA